MPSCAHTRDENRLPTHRALSQYPVAMHEHRHCAASHARRYGCAGDLHADEREGARRRRAQELRLRSVSAGVSTNSQWDVEHE
ncbi:unnamed protein product [Mycena citricolor]|uniref:Uncharacterized protein n=1 Tax=Mycena citricolor TaxID=2018698 RepID=A0AAD2HF42_9AGAR|nr:unnamed protein product [Mycena citricolor]